MTDSTKLVLASSSPRRHQLLAFLGLPFEIKSSSIEERINERLSAREIVIDLAEQKARDVLETEKSNFGVAGTLVVIGADTLVFVDGQWVGKPKDKAEAKSMLRRLSGRDHQVYTGVAVLKLMRRPGEKDKEESFIDATVSKVFFRALSDAEIIAYIETGEPMDKAGAYALQGTGAFLVDKVEGCVSNIVGLPIPMLVSLLRQAQLEVLGETGQGTG